MLNNLDTATKIVRRWLAEYYKKNKLFCYDDGGMYDYACILKSGQIMISNTEMYYSEELDDWTFPGTKVNSETIKMHTVDCCPLYFWDNTNRKYDFDWRYTKIYNNQVIV